ncbi:DUF885 domain-containing protein [Streptomyces sp. NBC_01142]|uniref:DUF885 family protein n=1 Tax=Streptomyces sp. NBC_01142 TaxID=2975865 RepID=UPI002253739F|nr:DUF885 family protein [Streptomyces sp. NBC_01142]MCX4821283.1 DUF885 domain-containing protein [Streptomyces sp. NBC_01142]
MDSRLRAITALSVPRTRELAGLHDAYDGRVQDLSPDGVRSALSALEGTGGAEPYPDPHDEAHARASETAARVHFEQLEQHRSNPFLHIANLDTACYHRAYAPAEERLAAKAAHLRQWPEAVDAAVSSLDRVSSPVARATLPAARALADCADGDERALAALTRLVDHLEHAAGHGDPSAALGGEALRLLMSSAEACEVDLSELADSADAERVQLLGVLREARAPGESVAETVRKAQADHPPADDLLEEARALAAEAAAWAAERNLVPYSDGECLVLPAPASRRHVMAGLQPAAPGEADAASLFHITTPDPAWPQGEQEQWLSVLNRSFLAAFVLHEVAPGHFSHGRALRRAEGDVRRILMSEAFTEGWAVYAEHLALEEGFRAHDPRTAVGIALSGLQRATRLSCAIGLHTGAMTVQDAERRFTEDAFLEGPAARAEARRGLWDPQYGHYTWGKTAIFQVRERARAAWGAAYSPARFHSALLALGAPPLGLLDTAVERG